MDVRTPNSAGLAQERLTGLGLASPESLPQADTDEVKDAADLLDHSHRAALARLTLGLSPAVIAEAYVDWAVHLAASPGRQMWLGWKALRKYLRYSDFLLGHLHPGAEAGPCIEPLSGDHRFDDPAWQNWPFNAYYQGFLLWQQWWHNATADIRGVSDAHQRVVQFAARQMLDTIAPSNFLWTNPVVLARTKATAGMNLVDGFRHFADDMRNAVRPGSDTPGNPAVGQVVAITPGKVVFRNHLIELIQYAPSTEAVRPEPILIVPAWIMKYYILDLSPENSLVRYLVKQGFTVFMISWRNPGPEDRDLSMDDYLRLGIMAAIDAACGITENHDLHAVGYCLGGTLLSIAASAMARDADARLRTVSLFAAQQDFTEAGELTLFTSSSQIALLEDMMWEHGFLEASQMAGAFQILHSKDLIWSRVIEDYLLGERTVPTDLMAWNADTTRMPARMHSEYLRHLFLNNDLAEGRYRAFGEPVAIGDIKVPICAVGTLSDHVAPWRSAHKIHLLTDAEVTFILTAGGHNAGIVSEPGHRGRWFGHLTRPAEDRYIPPDTWLAEAEKEIGSWWPFWTGWLADRSSAPCPPPPLGRPSAGFTCLTDAPGIYVREI